MKARPRPDKRPGRGSGGGHAVVTPEPSTPGAPSLEEIEAARRRIRGVAVRTPLLRLQVEDVLPSPPPTEIWLKLENLQPIGSFKLRGATNAMRRAEPATLEKGVTTASAGNMAQGVAWSARELGVPATVVMPDHAPRTKLEAVRRLGGEVVQVPFERWWQVLLDHAWPGHEGLFIHPVSDRAVMAGNGTVGLEILEDLPDVDTVLVPFGGGGLSCGIAAALRAQRPEAKVLACEVATAAPLSASLAAGEPREIDYRPSFVDGIGGRGVLPEMWPLARDLLTGSRVVTLEQTADAIRLLAERQRVIAEGAGAASVAAALASLADPSSEAEADGGCPHGADRPHKIVCVVSGGNLDTGKLTTILQGEVP